MRTTWNLELLYNSISDSQIEKDIQKSKEENALFVSKWSKNTEYLTNPNVLKEALDDLNKLEETSGQAYKPYFFFMLKREKNQTDTKLKAKYNQIEQIVTNLSNDIQFFELNLSKVPKNKKEEFLSSPILEEYKHFLECLFNSAKYLLSDQEEKIFNITSKTSHSNWVDMLTELLDKQKLTTITEEGKHKEITYNEISRYLNSPKRIVRDYAAKQFNKINSRYAEIAEFEINSVLEGKKISDEYRKIERPDITRHLADDIDTEIIDTLTEVVTKNFDIPQKYYKLKTKNLKQRKLGYHERNVQVGNFTQEYPYAEAMKIVKKSFKKLDPQFAEIVKQYEEEGHYDVKPSKGKSGGAYCTTMGKNLPTYILLNHKDQIEDVLTIAHESGHGIHAELSRKQNGINSGHPISLAEVASTFFEDFVFDEILKDITEEKEKISILNMKLNNDISTIFRQVAFYNFEKELHFEFRKDGFISKERISDIFCKHMKTYLGDTVKDDESMRNGWIYVTHFRRFFYVYSYASGLLISKSLQASVREDPTFINKIKIILEAGSTKSPKDLFLEIGIDISKKEFWEKGIQEIRKDLEKLN